MSRTSLVAAVRRIGELLDEVAALNQATAPQQPVEKAVVPNAAGKELPADDSDAERSKAD
jgi:hypothetical protein